ncbi:coiled-coil domain-containing protein 30 isoform X4 [Pelobates fuscus]|uniref:coiled-coil domain-containing protein 30 isoform X4 n=1 Tax=Pelobates fuscus TaxID=191477 RepID=UPI002FE4E0BB
MDKDHFQLEDIIKNLKEDGLDPGSSGGDHLTFLWKLYQGTQGKLQEATNSLMELKQQQAEEMKEVENYVAHIRSLTEEREALTTDFEKENIQLRIELEKLQVQQESQLKEVEEMLYQEGLNEIAQSSPSEQIAYLLVERATLLEKLDLLEHKCDSQLENLSDINRQDELQQIHQTLEEELYQQRKSMKRTKETLNKEQLSSIQNPWKKLFGIRKNADRLSADNSTYDEALDKEKKMRACIERDMDEASRRLQMSHGEIRRLTDEILIKDKVISELEQSMQRMQQESEALKQNLKIAQENDSQELQKAKEYSSRLDKEILALRNRVKSLDSERKKYMEQFDKSTSESLANSPSKQNTNHQENELLHKSCRLAIEGRECLNQQLLHKLQKLQREHDETVERNEELESILGETQNKTKEQIEYFESQTAGLQNTIMSLEAELIKLRNGKKERLGTDRGSKGDLTKMQDLQQIAKLTEECKRLQTMLNDQKTSNETRIAKEQAFQHLQDKVLDLEKLREENGVKMSESKKKCETLQKQLQEGMNETQKLWEEALELRQEIQSTRQDLQTKREENARLKREIVDMQNKMPRPQSCGDGAEEMVPKFLAGDTLMQQSEEIRQLRQDLHRVQNVCSSAEKELRYERDKKLDMKKEYIALQQDNTKLNAELNQVKQKLAAVSATCFGFEAEVEKRQQKVKELELDLMKRNQGSKLQSNWQEKLEHEKSRAVNAEKMVLELQQQLRASEHQLQLLQTQITEKKRQEEELKRAKENETKLRAQLQEEQLKRKMLNQSIEDLKQTNKALHEKETLLTQTYSALQFKLNQKESLLQSLDDEKNASAKERIYCENNNQKLSEELLQVQQDKEELHKEYNKILNQMDDYVRKNNEKQLRYKAKLSRAKEVHISEVNQRDLYIKQLEMEIALSKSQTEKDQQWISKVTTENEHLLKENQHMLQKLNDQEAIERNYQWQLLSVRNRAHILDEENKQLQEGLLQLYNQVGSLDRILKKIQALNLEEITKMIPSECLLMTDTPLHLPTGSFSALGFSSPPGVLKAIHSTNHEGSAETLNLSHSSISEIGYLNVTSPGIVPASPEQTPMPGP